MSNKIRQVNKTNNPVLFRIQNAWNKDGGPSLSSSVLGGGQKEYLLHLET